MIKIIAIALLALSSASFADIKVTSWNIEHLGSSGRGFGGGFGGGKLPLRTDKQLKHIGVFIRDTLKSDIIAFQEVFIDSVEKGESRSKYLDKVASEMGVNWKYYLPPTHVDHSDKSMYVGYLWNSNTVHKLNAAPLNLPNLNMAGKNLFDRAPVLGYFETIEPNKVNRNDFLLVNVHLASGQDHDENHLIAMTLIEYNLTNTLKTLEVKESDRIILGDFNDNPYAKNKSGKRARSDAMYRHMAFKGYNDLVTDDFHSTRMDKNLRSVIDHVLVNASAKKHLVKSSADIYLPNKGDSTRFAEWRNTYSDHFPISIELKTGGDDDTDW